MALRKVSEVMEHSSASDVHGEVGPPLRSLVQTYISYLSGCDACTIESLRSARTTEGDPARLRLLPSWRRAPSPTYSERERIALVWAEVVAILGEEGVDDTLRRQGSELFSEEELASLTRIVMATRGYRRMLRERDDGPPSQRRAGRRKGRRMLGECGKCAIP